MTADPAQAVLEQYGAEIKSAARRLTSLYPGVELEDALQEASILVATYAGLMPGRHEGILGDWEAMADGDPDQVRSLMSYELHLDLCRSLGPQEEQRPSTVSLDAVPPDSQSYTFEDAVIDRIDQERSLRRKYPYLAMVALDELTELEISRRTGEPYRSVKRHLAQERELAQADAQLMAELGREPAAEREPAAA